MVPSSGNLKEKNPLKKQMQKKKNQPNKQKKNANSTRALLVI
jgi:hypothetical protein